MSTPDAAPEAPENKPPSGKPAVDDASRTPFAKAGGGELGSLDPRNLIEAGLRSQESPLRWEPPSAEELHRLLPQYEIEAILGRGGMGAVYKGRQAALDRPVAIKLLPAEMAATDEFVARFQREARTLAKLHHPGIVLVHDFGQTSEGHLYFVMEFVDGTDLHKIIHGPGLACAQALEIVTQICDALQYAHSQGVVHRDIKPANVILTQDGRTKLADFGLARPLDDGSGAFTRSNVVMGTPDYMAPEALAGEADHRADLYSLGVMLYEMLTGKPPRGAWPPPSQRVQIDVRLDQVVLRALQEDPAMRYQQASEIKTDVDVIRSTPVGKAPRKKAGDAKSNPRRASDVAARIMMLLLLIAIGASVWFFAGFRKTRTLVPEETIRSDVSSGRKTDEVVAEAPVLAARERGGRLRVFGHRSDRPIELGNTSAFDDFVEVSIGNGAWVARRANGETYGQAPLQLTEPKKIGPIYTTHLLRGLGDPWMRMTDGSFGHLLHDDFQGVFDPGWTDTAGYLLAYGSSLVLASDGSIHDWVGGWDVPGRARPPVDFFRGASAWASGDNSFVAADQLNGVRSFRADGTLTNFPAAFQSVVEMDAGRDHVVMRSSSGEVFVSDGVGQPYEFGAKPLDLDPAVAIRAGCRMSAAQMADGTWRAWGESNELVSQVATIGHAIDLDLHSDSSKVAYMMWIEPVISERPSIQWNRIERTPEEWAKTGQTLQADGWVRSKDKGFVVFDRNHATDLPKASQFAVRARVKFHEPESNLYLVNHTDLGSTWRGVQVWPNKLSFTNEAREPSQMRPHAATVAVDEEAYVEILVSGDKAYTRFNGQPVVTGDVSPAILWQKCLLNAGLSCSLRDLEYAILDGIPDPLKALGWEVPEAEAATKVSWQKARFAFENQVIPPNPDGWHKTGVDPNQLHFHVSSPDGSYLELANVAIRFTFRWSEDNGGPLSVFLRHSNKRDGLNGHVEYLVHKDRLVVRRNAVPGAEVSLAKVLSPGDEAQFEIISNGDSCYARLNGQVVPFDDGYLRPSGQILVGGWKAQFKDFEYAHLDGIPDPLKTLGWELPEPEAAVGEPWRDFLAELENGPHRNQQLGRVWEREGAAWRVKDYHVFMIPDEGGRDLAIRATGSGSLGVFARDNKEAGYAGRLVDSVGRARIQLNDKILREYRIPRDEDGSKMSTIELRAVDDTLTLLVDDVELGSVQDESLVAGGSFGVNAGEGSLVEKVEYRFLGEPTVKDTAQSPAQSQRELAERLLGLKAELRIRQPGSQMSLKFRDPLPDGDFSIYAIVFPTTAKATDETFALVSGAPDLHRLQVNGPVTTLAPVVGLTKLFELSVFAGDDKGENTLPEEEMRHLVGLSELDSLTLSFINFNGEGCRHLTGATKLKSLFLGRNGERARSIDASGAVAIASLESVTSLTLRGRVFDPADPAAFRIITAMPNLTRLDLGDTTITREMLVETATMSMLQDLSLGFSCKLESQEFSLLAPLADRLTQLSFGYDTNLSDAGVKEIADTLINLNQFNLGWINACTGVSLRELARLPKLHDFRYQKRDGLIRAEDFEALTQFPALNQLHLASGDLTDDHLKPLGRCPNLAMVNLYSNRQITDAALAHLHSSKTIRYVEAIGTQVTDAGIAALKAALPGCNVKR